MPTALEAIFQAMSEGVVVFDMAGQAVLINEAEARICGYVSAEEMKRDLEYFAQVFELSHPNGSLLPVEGWPISRVLRGETLSDWQLRGRRKDTGQEWFFAFSGAPIRDEAGKQFMALVITRDITERMRTEEQLRESERQFRTLADSIPQLAWIAEADGSIHWYNQRWYEYTGTTLEEMEDEAGWGWKKVHDPAHLPRVEARFRSAVASGQPWEDTFPLRRKDGEFRLHLSRAQPLRDAQGKVVRWFGTNTDVEDQRRAEAALKQSEARLRAFFEANLIGLIFFDMEGGITEANDAFLEAVGYTREDLREGRIDWRRLTPPEWHALDAELVEEMLRTGRHCPAEKEYFRKDGTRLPLIVASTFFPGSRKEGIGFILDITERKAAEEQQRRVYEFQDRLIGIASHDIRSPTAAILTTSQTLLARPGLDEKLRRPVERIARSAARVERLIGALLDYTRARLGGGIPVMPQAMDLREVVAQGGEEARAAHPSRDILLELGAPVPGVWDANRLAQVVSNLLDNALKYGEPTRPIRVSLREEAGAACLEVHNEGPAIPKELLSSLFEPFQRGEQRDETIKLSLGLGLYIVREVVRAHGGTVEVQSDEARGTTFRVRLPMERPTPSQEAP
jgi:PAS domain S-box-containing protein